MSLLKKFQKGKWQKLAKSNASYYVFSEKEISDNENQYKESGKDDFKRFITNDIQLNKYFSKNNLQTCLELGCGNGRMTDFFADNFKKVYAVDISDEMIELSRKRLANKMNIDYIISDGEKINLPDNSVGFVFSYAVLQHFPSRKMVRNVLKEFYRVMNFGGVAKLQFRGRAAYGGPLRYFKWYYGVSFSENKIKNILSDTGFNIIKSEGANTKLLWILVEKN